MNLSLRGFPSFLSARQGSWGGGASLSLGPLQRRPPPPPRWQAPRRCLPRLRCRPRGFLLLRSAPTDGAAASRGRQVRGRRRFRPRRKGPGGGGRWRTPSPCRPRRFHLRGLGGPPRGLIRRGCAWRTLNIWIPARPLPRPAPPGLRRCDPAARASRPRFSRKRGNPVSNLPRVRACALGNSHWLRPMLSPISQVGNLGSRTPQQS